MLFKNAEYRFDADVVVLKIGFAILHCLLSLTEVTDLPIGGEV